VRLSDLPGLDDLGNAARLAALHGDTLRYLQDRGEWRVWQPPKWRSHQPALVYRKAADVVRHMRDELPDLSDDAETDAKGTQHKSAKAAYAAHIHRTSSRRAQEDMVRLCAHMEGIACVAADFDTRVFELNTPAGVWSLADDGGEGPNKPELLHSKSTRVAPNPFQPTPTWDAFLRFVTCNDAELAAWLQRAVGMSLIGRQQEHVFLFCSGDGGNGKGTFLNTLVDLLGDYGQTLPPNMLVERKSDAHLTELADLEGCRMVIGTEVPRGSAWDEVKIKMLTGGDRIRARKMRQDLYEFAATHTFWISGNDRPRLRGTDNGIWRRMRVIPFNARLTEAEMDIELDRKLADEAPGILAWALEGCRLFRQHKLGWCEAVRAATEGYRKEEDILGGFVEEECILGDGVMVTKEAFRGALRMWLEAREYRPISDRALKPDMLRKGFSEHRDGTAGVWHWCGVKLRTRWDVVVDDAKVRR